MPVNFLCEAFKKKDITSQPDDTEEIALQLSKGKALQVLVAQECLVTAISEQTDKVPDGVRLHYETTDPVTLHESSSHCGSFAEEACFSSIQGNFNLIFTKHCSVAEALRLIGRSFVSRDAKT